MRTFEYALTAGLACIAAMFLVVPVVQETARSMTNTAEILDALAR